MANRPVGPRPVRELPRAALPAQLGAGPLIGRDTELARLTERVQAGGGLLTIMGLAGVGKTRLVSELLRTSDAVFVSLVGAHSEPDVVRALASALCVRLADEDFSQALVHAIRERRMSLLVLDFCDDVRDAARSFVETCCARVPELTVVATCRTPLGARNEELLEVFPLPVPTDAGHPDASPAFQLWRVCVRRVVADYDPRGRERDDAVEVVRALDGLPLAIELAAPRMRILDASTLSVELRDRFAVLGRTRRRQDGHDTLRDALEASWRALDADEQLTAIALSVVRGSFGLRTAEALIAAAGVEGWTLDRLQTLRDASWIVPAREGAGVRLQMYETTRAFARSQATPEVTSAVERALCRHFGARAEAELGGRRSAVCASDEHNLLGVLSYVATADDPSAELVSAALFVRMLLHLDLSMHALYQDVADSTRAICAHASRLGDALSPRLRAYAAALEGQILHGVGSSSIPHMERALAFAREARDSIAESVALRALATRHAMGDDVEATERTITLLQARQGVVDRITAALEATSIAFATVHAGREPDVLALLDALDVLRPERPAGFYGALQDSASALMNIGRFDAAERIASEALALAKEHGSLELTGRAMVRLAQALQGAGRDAEAVALQREAIRLHQAAGGATRSDGFTCAAWCGLAVSSATRGDFRASLEQLAVARRSMVARGNVHFATAWRAWMLAAAGDVSDARSALAELIAQPRTTRVSKAVGALAIAYAHELIAKQEHGGAGVVDAAVLRATDEALASTRAAAKTSEVARALVRALETDRVRRASGELSSVRATSSWVFEASGLGFLSPLGTFVSLANQPLLVRVLAALLDAHRAGARYVPIAELVTVGWPGERMRDRSATERVRATMKRLRRFGLASLLESHGGAYRLSPTARFEVVDDPVRFGG